MRRVSGAARLLRALAALGAAVLSVAAALPAPAAAGDGASITVCQGCAVSSIAAAIAQAEPGARILVDGGTYPGQLVIDRPVQLIGTHDAVIDAGGRGTAVTIGAPDVTLRGFTIRATGSKLDREDSAVLVNAAGATIAGNRIEDALFGIYLKNAHGSVLRDNTIASKALPVGERGDAVRAWYSNNLVFEHNTARNGRDIILWYSHDSMVRDNTFEENRYGLHLMYSDRTRIEGNTLRSNSVGIFIMYSLAPIVVGNLVADNHGPSGMGMGLKGVDDAEIDGNRFVSNRVGVQVDSSPQRLTATVSFTNNVFAYNGSGMAFLPNVQRNTVVNNDFLDNLEQVAILGSGKLRNITWSAGGRGNYWSDYVGYDANGDGVGDLPYRSQHLFESLTDRHEALGLFRFSPAVTAIDFAAKAFPAVRPETKLTDSAPLMQPVQPAGLPELRRSAPANSILLAAIGLAATAGGILMITRLRRRPPGPLAPPVAVLGETPAAAVAAPSQSFVTARDLTKQYGSATAVNGISFEVAPGTAMALWGPNGAGKTTILRCLLGIASYTGQVAVDGLSPKRDGRAIRQRIGFVPQELPVFPLTAGEMARFIASLKHVSYEQATARLALLGIEGQIDKAVSALSGGMRQRLALALALIGEPSVLLLDEPTANLDAHGRSELLTLLRRLKAEGMTLIFASHRPEDVLVLADQILAIDAGVIQERFTPEQFLRHLEADSHVRYLEPAGARAAADADRLGRAAAANGSAVSTQLGGRPGTGLGPDLIVARVAGEPEVERGVWTGRS